MHNITPEIIESFKCADATVALYVDHMYVSHAEATRELAGKLARELAGKLARDYRYYSLVPAFTTALELRGKKAVRNGSFADRIEAACFIAEAWTGNYIETGRLPSEDINVFDS